MPFLIDSTGLFVSSIDHFTLRVSRCFFVFRPELILARDIVPSFRKHTIDYSYIDLFEF